MLRLDPLKQEPAGARHEPRRRNPRRSRRGGCQEWHDVGAFVAWIEANIGARPNGMTLDRIEANGHYEPGNVRWATKQQQRGNQRPRASTRARTELP